MGTEVRLDALPLGAAFRLAPCGLTGVVEHVSAAMVRVRIQRRLDAPAEHTAWAGSTLVSPIAAGRLESPLSASLAAPSVAQERAERKSTRNPSPEFRHTSQRLVCAVCGARQPRQRGRGRPSRFCSPACRTAAWRQRAGHA
jgi:hypothetical protein